MAQLFGVILLLIGYLVLRHFWRNRGFYLGFGKIFKDIYQASPDTRPGEKKISTCSSCGSNPEISTERCSKCGKVVN